MRGLLPVLLLLCGCAVERNGVTRHVILGFGVVSVPHTNTVATVTRVSALGFYAAPGQCGIGFVNGTRTQVEATATNVLIEVSSATSP